MYAGGHIQLVYIPGDIGLYRVAARVADFLKPVPPKRPGHPEIVKGRAIDKLVSAVNGHAVTVIGDPARVPRLWHIVYVKQRETEK